MLILRTENLQGSGVAHGFFGRTGGVSRGIYASLNCGTGSRDAPGDVSENRRRALGALGGAPAARLVTCYQIHSANAVIVREPWTPDGAPKADAMVTNEPGIALGILTADCAPILLADKDAHVIGAAHAGWNGAISGVAESVIAAMTELGARRERIKAAIGPCISQRAYEVGPEFEARFRERDSGYTAFFEPSTRAGHWQFDLEAFAAGQLTRAGIAGATLLSACTYRREQDFFSFRRTTHRGEPDYGRQLSAIMLSN